MKTVGVLAFHGDFAEHIHVLHSLNVSAHEVRSIEDLKQCTHLIIPGGESTVIAKLLKQSGLDKEIVQRFEAQTLAVYGTCAGAILLAKKAVGRNAPRPLGLIDMKIDRNAYGSQMQSFEAALKVKSLPTSIHASFIRAPRIMNIRSGVGVLAYHGKDPVLVQQGRALAGTFHPEVRGESAIHKLFLNL